MVSKDLAVIGAGYWGKNLVRNFHTLGVLHTICDKNSEILNQFGERYSDLNLETNFIKVLQNPTINKIVIATPTWLHHSIAKAALEAGKDVFIEKAMCSNLEESIELADLADQRNAILMIGHLLHYHPAIVQTKKIIKEGALGELLFCQFNRSNFGSNGVEKSALWAFAPHDISLMLSFCSGRKLQSISSSASSLFSPQFSDQNTSIYTFENNLKAHISVSWIHPTPERKFMLVGTKGTLVFDDLLDYPNKIQLFPTQRDITNEKLSFSVSEVKHFYLEDKEPLLVECETFLKSCQSRLKPTTDAAEGLRVMALLDAIDQSVKEEKSVDFPDGIDKYINQRREEISCVS